MASAAAAGGCGGGGGDDNNDKNDDHKDQDRDQDKDNDNDNDMDIEDRALGVVLAHLCGDALGAAMEGHSQRQILMEYGSQFAEEKNKGEGDREQEEEEEEEEEEAQTNSGAREPRAKSKRGRGGGGVRDMIFGIPMGLTPEDTLPRRGCYTDDGNAALALAWSLAHARMLDPVLTAVAYAKFYLDEKYLKRGCPRSATELMRWVLASQEPDWTKEKNDKMHAHPIMKSGTSRFPDGSFANGSAMKIAPLAVAFRNATDDELHEATRMAVVSTHVHPEAIDGAWLISKAESTLLKLASPSDMQPREFLVAMRDASRNEVMRSQMEKVISMWDRMQGDEPPSMHEADALLTRTLGASFQLRAKDAVPAVMWCAANHWDEPEEALVRAIALGGDTDTVAAMVGGIVGALHGSKWLPVRWIKNMEDGYRGITWARSIAASLAQLDLRTCAEPDKWMALKDAISIPLPGVPGQPLPSCGGGSGQ